MKKTKRLLSICLIVIAMMSVLTMPASAAVGGLWTDEFPRFPLTQRGNVGNYVGALQRYLEAFDATSRSYLGYKNSLGETIYVDGDFGGGTEDAVRYIQGVFHISVDGQAGEKTWTEIEKDLNRYTDNWTILKRSLYNPYYIYKLTSDPYLPGGEVLSYYKESNYGSTIAFAWAT